MNTKGGKGNNVESDLCQEHSVCNQKGPIKQLGANKSEQAISRVTSSADTLAEICSKFDESVHIKQKVHVIQRQFHKLTMILYTRH
jgi:hypothetical protein